MQLVSLVDLAEMALCGLGCLNTGLHCTQIGFDLLLLIVHILGNLI